MAEATDRKPKLGAATDLLVAVGILGILGILVIAMPPALLSMLLILNLAISLLIVLVSFYILEPLQFSTFPALLLIVTMFRLAMNVASTKLILGASQVGGDLKGKAGVVIEFFGQVVARDDPVVGFVVFLIMVLINFIVITKGAGRIAEVAARFTLDAMPGKQMAIDADLNAGLISEQDARNRRTNISREADFYGAMDGASKFVRGDAIAGLIITAINILGGVVVGVAREGQEFLEVLQTYTILTIGDGLVTQIPALLVSMASGIVVTRAASDTNLGEALTTQMFGKPKVLYLLSVTLGSLGLFAMVTGSFAIGFLLLLMGGAFVFAGNARQRGQERQEQAQIEEEKRNQQEAVRSPEEVESLLAVDPMEIEVGYALIPIVDREQGGDLLDRVTLIRRQLALDLGIVVPPIRIRDNMQLPPNAYAVRIRGSRVAGGELMADRLLAMKAGEPVDDVPGVATKEPAFGLPARWIAKSERSRAEMIGYNVIEPSVVLATHLTEVIRANAPDLLDRQAVQRLVDRLRETHAVLINELVPDLLGIGQIQKVLQMLLRERVCIRDLGTVLEALADAAHATRDISQLTEMVRTALARPLTQSYIAPDGNLYVMTLEPRLEQTLVEAIQKSPEGSYLTLDPQVSRKLLERIGEEMEKVAARGFQTVLLTNPQLRPHVRALVERFLPHLAVMSYTEVSSDAKVQSSGVVRWETAAQEAKR